MSKNNTKTSEYVANTDSLHLEKGTIDTPQVAIESRILTIRGQQVILDRDLAGFYGVEKNS